MSTENPSTDDTKALLLSCMDFRLTAKTTAYMESIGWKDRYDHVVLAGASLGATNSVFPDWKNTFFDHVKLAEQLHDIQQVFLLDHRDCGAYKEILKDDSTDAHRKHLHKLKHLIRSHNPDLGVETLLMNLDGSVEEIK